MDNGLGISNDSYIDKFNNISFNMIKSMDVLIRNIYGVQFFSVYVYEI